MSNTPPIARYSNLGITELRKNLKAHIKGQMSLTEGAGN